MKTTALYDDNLKQFILHTPNFEAAKCWVGCLGDFYIKVLALNCNINNYRKYTFSIKLKIYIKHIIYYIIYPYIFYKCTK